MADVVIGGMILAAIAVVLYKKAKDKKAGKSGCGCGCGGCVGKGNCFGDKDNSDE